MRIMFRNTGNREYWANRWAEIPVYKPMTNIDKYPLKYASMIVKKNNGRILEAGCGNGRILRYYHDKKYEVFGVDFVDIAIKKLLKKEPSLNI